MITTFKQAVFAFLFLLMLNEIKALNRYYLVPEVENTKAEFSADKSKIFLSWDCMAGTGTHFRVYRNGIVLADNITEKKFTDSTFNKCIKNKFTVIAVYNGEESEGLYTAEIWDTLYPAELQFESIPNKGNKIVFSFPDKNPETIYSLFRKTLSGSFSNILTFTSANSEFFDPTGVGNYSYRVSANRNTCNAVSNVYTTKVLSDGPYMRIPYCEMFTGENCTFSKPMEENSDAAFETKQDSFVGIKYYMPWRNAPALGHFYYDNKEDNNAVASYYNVNSIPQGFANGFFVYSGASEINKTNWNNSLNSEYGQKSPFKIELSQTMDELKTKINWKIVIRCNENVSGVLKLRMAVVERVIDFTVAPGSNGQLHFEDMMKKFVPDFNGILLKNDWNDGDSVIYFGSWLLQGNLYNPASLGVNVWIQNNSTHYIYQSAKTGNLPVSSLKSVGKIPFSIYPVPAHNVLYIRASSEFSGILNYSITDLKGLQITKGILSEESANKTYSIDISDLSAGVYFIQVDMGSSKGIYRIVVQ